MTLDPWGALVDDRHLVATGTGPLDGRTVVVKDLVDVAGSVTGAGQPTWAATHGPATVTAPAVRRLLAAGAEVVGRAHTAEMAYSLSGDNAHHGMPVNPAHPGLDPGGSSSGSAAAVAGGRADLGLGTDTLGSVRVPASSCGLFGWRPTHGLVPTVGVHPLAHSLDTVGLLARDPEVLVAGADVLAGGLPPAPSPGRVRRAAGLWDHLDPATADALLALADEMVGPVAGTVDLTGGIPVDDLVLLVRDVQGPEFAAAHRDWIAAAAPRFGPGVAERIAHALAVGPEVAASAGRARAQLRAAFAAAVAPGDVVVLPAAGPPAEREVADEERARARAQAARCSVVASLVGAPTVVVPGVIDGAGRPVGLALLGAPGSDALLLRLAAGRPPAPSARHPGSA